MSFNTKNQKVTPEQMEFLVDSYQYNKKWTTPKIAKLFGISRQRINQKAKRMEELA